MANEIKIKQTNLNNGAVEIGKFYPNVEVFFGIRAYTNEDKKEVIKRLKNSETKFTVSWGVNNTGKILYEVLD